MNTSKVESCEKCSNRMNLKRTKIKLPVNESISHFVVVSARVYWCQNCKTSTFTKKEKARLHNLAYCYSKDIEVSADFEETNENPAIEEIA